MRNATKLLGLVALAALALRPAPAPAYIGGPPASLGHMIQWSTHVMTVQVEKVDREKGVILFRKVRDQKGKWPVDLVKQAVPPTLAERKLILDWAEPGKTTVMFALESYKWSHTYIDNLWFAAPTADWSWWNVSHVEPILLRTFSGKPERLQAACNTILAGKETIVPCMVGENMQDLQLRKGKVQRLRASLKLTDYNPKRDFVDWGSDDFTALKGMPGFSAHSPLPRLGSDAQAISVADFDQDGKLDLCLVGAQRTVLLRNGGDAFDEILLPGYQGGSRAAVWADYNADGKPDLLLATPTGPRLFTNLGTGLFRDDTNLLPLEAGYDLTALAWIDGNADGRPDILLGNGYHGLRLYRNQGGPQPLPGPRQPNEPLPSGLWFADVSKQVGLGPDGLGGTLRGDTLTVADVNHDSRPDFLYGAGSGLLVLNTPQGFVEAKSSGINYKPGKVGPLFVDLEGKGTLSLLVPQLTGGCKLFHNDGAGRFADATAKCGDLAKWRAGDVSPPVATCAATGDFDGDGHVDLFIGCLRGPNRFLKGRVDGSFVDATETIGLDRKIYNTQGIVLVDLNNDGQLDAVFCNEGQEGTVLLGTPQQRERTPLLVQVGVGGKVRLLERDGKPVAVRDLAASAGRGGQEGPVAHFALKPGDYRVEVRNALGQMVQKEVRVADTPVRVVLD